MKNIRKTTDWIEMALEDLDAAVADFTEERYPASVFHAQQCTEKLLKAVLYFFGIIHEKTHSPSDILAGDILNNPEMTLELQLDKDQIHRCSVKTQPRPKHGHSDNSRHFSGHQHTVNKSI